MSLRNRSKRFLLLLVAVVAVMIPSVTKAADEVEIVYYHRGYTTEVEWTKAIIERFEALNPHIKVESLSSGTGGGSDYSEKLAVMVAAGNAPDVFFGSTDKLGFILKGWTLDLTSYVERDTQKIQLDDFFPGVMDSFVHEGEIHGIPLTVTPQMIFYNRDMFEEHGLIVPPSDWNDTQWTWDTFLDVSRKLTVSNPNGIYSQLALSQATDRQLPDVSWMFGGDWFDEAAYLTSYPTHATMVTDENIEAFQAIVDLYSRYAAAGPRKGIDTYNGFARGQIAMDWIGAYKLNNYVENQRAGGMAFEWSMAATPLVENRANTRWTDPLFVASTTSEAEAAWEFVKYATGPEGQELWAEMTGKIPARQGALTVFVESMARLSGLHAGEIAQAVGGALEHGRRSIEESIADMPLEIFNNAGNWLVPMFEGRVAVRPALEEMERAMNAIIADRNWN